jgi:hypothetical protein
MRAMSRRRFGLLLTIIAGLTVAPAAHADRIAFECGAPAFQNLCAVAPDGSARETLFDGATGQGQDRYGSPSFSADGAKLAYTYKGQAYVKNLATGATAGPELSPGNVLLTRMRADGAFMALEEFSGGTICVYAADLTGRRCVGRSGSFGFASNGDILTDTTVAPDYRSAICRLPIMPDDGLSGCHGIVLQDASQNLADATTSPDGRLIAVTRSTTASAPGRIAIFDASSGALLHEVSSGPDDFPAWSPDSTSVVFDRANGGGVWIASATGAPGGERLLVADGRSPTWGGGGPVPNGPGSGTGTGGLPPGTHPTTTCKVPSLVGLTLAAARRKLKTANCATAKVTRRRSSARKRGKVLTQGTKAGRGVARTVHVAVVVGK